MRHEKTVSVSKIKPVWEPWEEDETPRKFIPEPPYPYRMCGLLHVSYLPIQVLKTSLLNCELRELYIRTLVAKGLGAILKHKD